MENVINIGSTDYWNGYIVLHRNRVTFLRVTAMDYSEMEEAIRDSWRPAEDWREEVSEWYTDVWLEEYLEDYEYDYEWFWYEYSYWYILSSAWSVQGCSFRSSSPLAGRNRAISRVHR